MLSTLLDYYQRRLLDAAAAAHSHSIKDKFLQTIQLPPTDTIKKMQTIGENMYLVPSENTEDLHYIVYADISVCTCFYGNTDTICKHIEWVHRLYHLDFYERRLKTLNTEQLFLKVATREMPHQNSPLDKLEPTISGRENIVSECRLNSPVAGDSDIEE